MPILTLCPISPGSCLPHLEPQRAFWQRSSPSSERSTRNAAVSLPGPRARSRKRSMPRFNCMIEIPSSGSTALISTPAPIPGISLETFSMNETAVSEIDIGVATLEKQRAIARGHPLVPVPGGVSDDIGFRFNNTTADDAFGQFSHHYFAKEIAGERHRIDRQPRASERQIATLAAVMFHGIRSTHSAREDPARTDRRNTASRERPFHRGTP